MSERGAKVIPVPPPVIYLLAFGAGLALHAMTDDHIGGRPVSAWLGAVPIAAGLALGAGAIRMFARAHTTVIPHHRVSEFVTSGPYRFSRNPMYTGLALITVGAALAIGTWWPLVTLVPALVIIRLGVIGPEERYLAETFGEDYSAYCATVRRWL
ncbi:MAG: isoprenylcysteine carboxylmethyltransferase family protein [Actinomycetota bacterium]|nr:isoprenylcysteine carboxylmethyltransferase family protein [Actinomycetota bacterium]